MYLRKEKQDRKRLLVQTTPMACYCTEQRQRMIYTIELTPNNLASVTHFLLEVGLSWASRLEMKVIR